MLSPLLTIRALTIVIAAMPNQFAFAEVPIVIGLMSYVYGLWNVTRWCALIPSNRCRDVEGPGRFPLLGLSVAEVIASPG